MKVKIGERIYDSNQQPIMIMFDVGEKELIGNMREQDMKFCSFPQGVDIGEAERFMTVEDEDQLSFCIEDDVLKVQAYPMGD